MTLRGIPVLMYHGIGTVSTQNGAADGKYWVPAASFRQQLQQLRYGGYASALLSELWGSEPPLPAHRPPVVLTFDDGRATDYEAAFPLLAEAGARADFFVNTATVGQLGRLGWAQIAEMQRAGMRFQSHAHDHVVLPALAEPQLVRQLSDSKALLEDRLGLAVEFLAAPYGLLDDRVIRSSHAVGYRAVCNSRNWTAKRGARVINRVAVHGDTTGERFAGLLRGRLSAYLPGYSRVAVMHVPKRVLLRVRPTALGASLATEGA